MILKTNAKVQEVFNNYPERVRGKMENLRMLILDTARNTKGIMELEETLRWGEPSYVAKNGSTLRIDWKSRSPDQYAMYFQCTSRLIDTFRLVFGNTFQYEGKRAIVFRLDQKIPVEELKGCIRAALKYHEVKHLMTLGI
ncbi:DUF1801 domain-containing protein [Flavobacteriaceae bacterium GF1]